MSAVEGEVSSLRATYWAARDALRRYRRGVLSPIFTFLGLPFDRAAWAPARALPIRPNSLLLLAWHFPPATNGGVFRPLSFARQAQAAGWSVQVVSELLPPDLRDKGRKLAERIPPEVAVTRFADARSRLPGDVLPQLDGGLANVAAGLHAVRAALQTHRPSLILASGPPFFNFVLARLLAARLGVPYAVEYRDEWSLCPHEFVQTGWLDRLAERWSLAGARQVVFATQGKLEHCLRHYPVFRREDAAVVPNGWDPSVGAGTVFPPALPRAADDTRPIRLVFAGTLASHADPGPFLAALGRLLDAAPAWRSRVVVEFIGHKQPAQRALLDRFAYPEVIEQVDFMPQEEVRQHLAAADMLLVFNPPEWHRYLQGKLLEYLAVPRPVLLYGAGGEMESLVNRAAAGTAVVADDTEALARAIERLSAWQGAESPERLAVVQALRRDVIADGYFRLLSRVQAGEAVG